MNPEQALGLAEPEQDMQVIPMDTPQSLAHALMHFAKDQLNHENAMNMVHLGHMAQLLREADKVLSKKAGFDDSDLLAFLRSED